MPIIERDWTNGLDYVHDGSGHNRYLAAFPTQNRAAVGLRRFADFRQVVPRSAWKDESLRPLGTTRWDQNGHGSCVGHGSGKAFMYAWLQSGQTRQEFSPTFLYGLINRGRDQGAIVGDALVALQKTGIALMSQVPETMIYKSQFPSEALLTAQRFRIDPAQSFDCPSFDEIASAVLSNDPVSFGVEIGDAFEPDGQGIVPDQRRGGGGHCMCAMGLKQINGKWYLEVENSWGPRWGQDGFCYLPESYFQSGDNWSLRAALDDPNDPNNPPVVKE
ncbi:MAG: C1 family peptidase [Pseudomonas sp.]